MRALASSSSVLLLPLFVLVVGCGGKADGPIDDPGGVATSKTDPPASTGKTGADPNAGTQPPGTTTTPPTTTTTTTNTPGILEGTQCAKPVTDVIVQNGGTIARPTGSVLRLNLVYQGSSVGVRTVRGVDMIISPSDGPFAAGKNSGYWSEVREAGALSPIYSRIMMDPTRLEAPGLPGGGGFQNSTIDRCEAKTILIDVPNDPASTAKELVLFGSPYGTQGPAAELARFSLH